MPGGLFGLNVRSMARRNRQSKGPSLLLGLVFLVLLLGAGFAAFKFLGLGGNGDFHGLTSLNVSEYLENSKSLQGNVYKVEGRVEDQLGWSGPHGRVLVVVSQGEPVGVKVPADFSDQNIQAGQSFAFKVRVVEGGILLVEALEKA